MKKNYSVERIKNAWKHKLKLFRTRYKRIKIRAWYLKNDFINTRKRKIVIPILFLLCISIAAISGYFVYQVNASKKVQIKIVDAINFEKEVSTFNNQTYIFEEDFLKEFESKFSENESIKQFEVLKKSQNEVSNKLVEYEAIFELNNGYEWSDNSPAKKSFSVFVFFNTDVLIDSDLVFENIKEVLDNQYFDSIETVVRKISQISLPSGVSFGEISYFKNDQEIYVNLLKEKNYYWLDKSSESIKTYIFYQNKDFKIFKKIHFSIIKNELENLIEYLNSESPILSADDLETRLSSRYNNEAVSEVRIKDLETNNEVFSFEVIPKLQENYQYENNIVSNQSFEIIIEKGKSKHAEML
ncbi:hypothetical protein CXP39_03230 [Mesoplasma syrphidae]|uniref:Uncharacterized protein n=1 Tax=Mesoplasma syrphidae TaxID=225999 RepID=A0A2K9BZJ8_9MOLU|nr:hypothetical protein [Mesoplasma syrphidae]AUF83788.1 hypothetical protein CXP39_03230 [Mesoplasma syrphidae]